MALWTVFLSLCLLIALRASVEAKPAGSKDCGGKASLVFYFSCQCVYSPKVQNRCISLS
ncbi:hypothetical protein PO909_000682 [Leuciscus waleckii]